MWNLAAGDGVKTGNPVTDAFLGLGSYAVVAVAAFFIVKYLYLKREQDWTEARAHWEKERSELFAFRELSRTEWDKERSELIAQRDRAHDQAEEFRKSSDRAMDGVKNFMEIAQKETMGALRESQSALGEAASRERLLTDRNQALEREMDLLRTVVEQVRRNQP